MGKIPLIKWRNRLEAALAFLFLLFCVSSCQVNDQLAPQYQTLEVTHSIEEAFQGREFISSSWIQDDWWVMFNDDQLSSLMQQMFQCNPSLNEAAERVSLAHNIAKQKLSPLMPHLEAEFHEMFAGFSWNSRGVGNDLSAVSDKIVPSWINLLGYLLKFRWSLDIWGKNRSLFKAAVDEVKMQMAEAVQTKLLLSTQLCEAYFDLQLSLNEWSTQNEILAIMKEKLSIMEKVYEHALADELELQHLEKEILAFENAMLTTKQNTALSIHKIKSLVGLCADDKDPVQKPTPFFGSTFPFPEKVPANLLLRRPDIVSKIWKLQAQAKKVKSAKVSFLPDIDLSSFSGFLQLNWDALLTPRGWFSSVLPGASLPIFKGLKLRSQLQYSVKLYNLFVFEYNQALLTAAKEVVDNIMLFRISNEQLIKHEEILQKELNLLELTSLRYEYGLNSYLDVLNTKIAVLNNEIHIGSYNRLHLLAALNLIKSLGGGYTSQEAEEVHQEPINL